MHEGLHCPLDSPCSCSSASVGHFTWSPSPYCSWCCIGTRSAFAVQHALAAHSRHSLCFPLHLTYAPALRPQDAVVQRSFAAEPIVALAASADGCHVAGGGASGHVYLWQAASGRLLRSWPAHYKV